MSFLPRLKSALGPTARVRAMGTFNRWPLLVSPAELRNLPKENLAILDVSWHMPNSPRNADEEFLKGPRIPGAFRFNLDKVAETDPKKNPLGLTHMLPSPETFRGAVEKLGITPDTHVVVYDTVGVFSAPRGVFTFKSLGHDKVSALNGGLPRWIEEGNDVDTEELKADPVAKHKSDYPTPKKHGEYVRSYEQMVDNATADPSLSDVVLDARAIPRYAGEAPEPRPGLPSGHIPHSLPLPFSDLLTEPSDAEPYTRYKSLPQLTQVIVDGAGGQTVWDEISLDGRGLIFSCGSGMTACVGWLGARAVAEAEGRKLVNEAVYDESWTGWAQRKESRIETGPGDRSAVQKKKE